MMQLDVFLTGSPLDRCYTLISIHTSQVGAWFLLVIYVLHLLP